MRCVLKDLILASKDGEWGKGESFDESVEMFAIRGTDFGKVRFGDLTSTPRRHIPRHIAERKSLQPWDVLIEAAGGTKNQITGRTVLLRPQLFSHADLPITCASFSRFIRFDTAKCDPEFIFWYLQHLYASGSMDAYHTQHTGVSRFQWTTFSEREPLEIPSLPIQHRIAAVLSAYDELIENSQRRIRIVETMARNLYREWFVNFRFPDHDKVALVASPLGGIPEGWSVGRLDDVIVLQRGFDLPKANRIEGTVPIYAATGVAGFHNEAKVKSPGVVTGRSGTIGDVLYVQEDFWPLNTVLWAKEFPQSEPLYAYYVLLSIDLPQFNSGAAVPTLNRNDIHGLPTLIPPRSLQKRFQYVAGEMLKQARTLELQSQNLRLTRDLLLPRLLSGQIDVEPA